MKRSDITTFDNKIVLITGGTGSFGRQLVKELLDKHNPEAIRIYSRDELKQWEMQNEFKDHPKFETLRFFIGDVRDAERLKRACEDVDIIVHAAALKQVPTAEYNPIECIKTNIFGAENVIKAALDSKVQRVVALSTDKAAAPINLYGATKLCSDKLFVAANNMKGERNLTFSVVRYGNVMGSRGSVIPFFMKKRFEGILPITHESMTRFNITLQQAVDLVIFAIKFSWGGEIFVPKIPSYKITELAKAIAKDSKINIVGIRPGEKLHEEMVTENDSYNTLEFDKYFVILPANPVWNVNDFMNQFHGKKVEPGFKYNSGTNKEWLSVSDIRKLIKQNIDKDFE